MFQYMDDQYDLTYISGGQYSHSHHINKYIITYPYNNNNNLPRHKGIE